jgi:soluble P-type ATPase
MVTGDHPDTAEAIAKQVHIIRDKTRRDLAMDRRCDLDDVSPNDPAIQAIVITGSELLAFTPSMLDDVLDYDQIVFARTSPKQKLIIVQGLQKKEWIRRGLKEPKRIKHVVAVTGDGVNDSPALKASQTGTQQAKHAPQQPTSHQTHNQTSHALMLSCSHALVLSCSHASLMHALCSLLSALDLLSHALRSRLSSSLTLRQTQHIATHTSPLKPLPSCP